LGVTTPIVPGLCGDEDKTPERCGQVATAIVQSVTSRLPGLHRKIAAVRVISRKTFLFFFGVPSGHRSHGPSIFWILLLGLGFP